MSIGFILYFVAPKAAYRRAASPQLKVHFPERSAQVWQSQLEFNRPRHSISINIMKLSNGESGLSRYKTI